MASDFVSTFGDLFDETDLGRRATFETLLSRLAQGSGSPITEFNRPAFSGRFDTTFNRFLGSLGQRVLAGQEPVSFAEFAENDFSLRDARRVPGSQIGGGRSQLVSPTRFLFR
jgi:hypothetical protein